MSELSDLAAADAHPFDLPPSAAHICSLIASHIRELLAAHRRTSTAPLMLMLQGPQGAGKTTITRGLVQLLKRGAGAGRGEAGSEPPLRLAILSLDDLYLDHAGLKRVAREHPENGMLQGRGLPGTHDEELGERVLRELQRINEGGGGGSGGPQGVQTVRLPIFDKSLHGGQGDRSLDTVDVEGPLDVVILEGWCLGSSALSDDLIRQRLEAAQASSRSRPVFASHPLTSLLEINHNFSTLTSRLYPFFSALITLLPSSLAHIYTWRLEAEHAMKAANGGRGMGDADVRRFVDRYMPVYELWGGLDAVRAGPSAGRWAGRSLAISIGEQREVTHVERF